MVLSKEFAAKLRSEQNPLKQQEILDEYFTVDSHLFRYNHLIAGGAPRNWLMGKAANDIDIFFLDYLEKGIELGLEEDECYKKLDGPTTKEKSPKKNNRKKKMGGGFAGIDEASEVEEYIGVGVNGEFRLIQSIYTRKWKGLELQYIILNYENCMAAGISSLQDFVEKTFDFNICKVWYDHATRQIIPTRMAAEDFHSQTLTVSIKNMIKYQRLTTLARRSAKLQGYFPNFKINIVP